MNKLKVASRLALGFGLLLLLLGTIDFIGVSRLGALDHSVDLVVNNRAPKVMALDDIALKGMDNARVVRNIILINDEKGKASNKETYDKNNAVIDEKMAYLDKHMKHADDKELLKALVDARAAYSSYTKEVIALGMASKNEEATTVLYGPNYKSQAAYFAAITKMVDNQKAKMEASAKDAAESYQFAFKLMVGLGVLACVLGAVIAWLISRGLTKQLGGEPAYVSEIATRVAEGDLTVDVQVRSGDTSSVVYAMKTMTDKLTSTVRVINEASDSIATGSAQIAAGNSDLSQRTEEQASSLEETASSMEELASTVKQNAENAKRANELASNASQVAVKGGVVVGEVVQTMSSINESSKKIADIIGVIDGIAFQTNILALNAAVEAARAGEQGRGFAVVASEVRTLAQRSAGAAKEIKELISDSVHKVEAGTRLVDDAGKTMDEVVSSVKHVTEIVAEISAASQEQSAGIDQVNTAITQMDQVTQQNAALVEEAAAAAESMREQAAGLGRAVGAFKLDLAAEVAGPRGEAAVERRGPDRAKNVTRLPAKKEPRVAAAAEPRKTGTDDEWSEF